MFFLPIGDAPNPRGFRPWVMWLILAVNVAVYLLFTLPLGRIGVSPMDLRALTLHLPVGLGPLSEWDLLVWERGFRPFAPSLSDAFSSLFMHAGLAHLAGNMLFLWIYGDNVEHRLGRLGALVVYLGTGLAAVAGHAALSPSSPLPLIGASGAVSGLLGVYFVLFPKNTVRAAFGLFPFFFRVIHLPARWVLGAYLLLDNLLPVVLGADGPVAYGAHIGGFVSGAGVAWLVSRRGVSAAPERSTTPMERVVAALQSGAVDEAAAEASVTPPEALGALPVSALVPLAKALAARGETARALGALRASLLRGVSDADAARLHLTSAEVLLQLGEESAATQQLLRVTAVAPGSAEADAARRLLPELLGARGPR
ncbi:rhomboid family intramembrane serine protease [Myxococcota bacterium]|nr:rhomboid family intramembrane serine protease [Myxococcota bacterium]